jgi:N4-(beta-N-acetylglucosaminyl)-L-asparaginase
MEKWSRRSFCLSSLAGGLAWSAGRLLAAAKRASGLAPAPGLQPAAARPLILSASNGFPWLDQGMTVLKKGGDTLDAVLAVVTRVEDDPNINTVGLGGLPNEDGVVQLDACVMHGPTRLAGAVGAIEEIKNPSLVARAVMDRTDHIFLVGRGATRFALDQGFKKMNLLTEKSRLAWLAWKASVESNWNPPLGSPAWRARLANLLDTPEKRAWADWIEEVVAHPPSGTISCMAVNEKGDLSGCTTTSGLAWKISGRVGDSPIIGAGLYLDNDVGAAGSTGRGEENIRIVGGHTVVEMMRRGKNPTDACLEALDRVVRNFAFDKSRLRRFYLVYYAVNKDGAHGAAALWSKTRTGEPFTCAVHDGRAARLVPCAALLEGATEM